VPNRVPALAEPHLRSIAANLRRRRTELKMTQERLAEAADLDLRFLQRVERAQMNLSIGTLAALAKALRLHPATLLRPAKLAPPSRGRPAGRT
jgi:transcriptional regulator with XRE-family HTH domain